MGENSPNFSCHISNYNSVFLKLCVSLKCHERQKKLYMIFTNVALKSAKFQSFNCSGEISPNLFFNRLLLLKVYKISAKKVQRSYVSWCWRVVQNLKDKPFFCFKKWNGMRNLANFHQNTWKCQNWYFYEILFSKSMS